MRWVSRLASLGDPWVHGQDARSCGGDVGLGLVGVGDAEISGRSAGTGHERGLPGPRSGGVSWCGLPCAAARGSDSAVNRASARHDDDLRRAASRARRWRGLLIVRWWRRRPRWAQSYVVTVNGAYVVIVLGGQQPSLGVRALPSEDSCGTQVHHGCADPRRTRCCCHRLDSSCIGSSVGREALRCKYGDRGS